MVHIYYIYLYTLSKTAIFVLECWYARTMGEGVFNSTHGMVPGVVPAVGNKTRVSNLGAWGSKKEGKFTSSFESSFVSRKVLYGCSYD